MLDTIIEFANLMLARLDQVIEQLTRIADYLEPEPEEEEQT